VDDGAGLTDGGEEFGAGFQSAADGDAFEGGGIRREQGLRLTTPSTQDEFDATELVEGLKEGGALVRVESAGIDSAGQCGPGVGFRVTVGKTPFLGEEFCGDDAALTGLEGEVLGTRRGAFPMDALAHGVDSGLPAGRPGGEVRLWMVEAAEADWERHETGGGGCVACDRASAEERLDFPESGPAAVVIRMRGDGVYEQPLFTVGTESVVDVIGGPDLGGGREQGDELRGIADDPRKVPLPVLCDEEQVEEPKVSSAPPSLPRPMTANGADFRRCRCWMISRA
jgi:hypothetical protein